MQPGSLEKWLNPGLGHEIYKVSLENLVKSEGSYQRSLELCGKDPAANLLKLPLVSDEAI